MTFRQRLARKLRFLADRLDDAGAPKHIGWCTAAINTAAQFPDDPYYQGQAELAENVIKSDALSYAHQPGYRKEWGPQ